MVCLGQGRHGETNPSTIQALTISSPLLSLTPTSLLHTLQFIVHPLTAASQSTLHVCNSQQSYLRELAAVCQVCTLHPVDCHAGRRIKTRMHGHSCRPWSLCWTCLPQTKAYESLVRYIQHSPTSPDLLHGNIHALMVTPTHPHQNA